MSGFPPRSSKNFSHVLGKKRVDTEASALGLLMTFRQRGSRFRARLEMPLLADHGPQFINFYMSFYSDRDPSSLVETGISFSEKRAWNFFANVEGSAQNAPLSFKPFGAPAALEVRFFDVKSPGYRGCCVTLGSQSHMTAVRNYEIDYCRLVVATAELQGSSWSSMRFDLTEIDGKAPSALGKMQWAGGGKVKAPPPISLIDDSMRGFRSSLP